MATLLKKFRNRQAGQALVEFTFIAFMMVALLFGLIDFGRAVYERQILTNLTREGANLASRATDFTNTINAVMLAAAPLQLNTKGRVIITSVIRTNNANRILAQMARGSLTAATSRIGTTVGGTATLPTTTIALPRPNQTVYVAEVYYTYTPITPIGRLLGLTLPTRIYDAAYF
ncbi:MAG: hypothetical protein PCFJNLEI_03720 [Verrucomicrobiae bacterium]|nr:hypothetical protein [Verrucomicrobiae bacterium]